MRESRWSVPSTRAYHREAMQRARQMTVIKFIIFEILPATDGEGGGGGGRDTARGSFTMIQEVLGMACLKSYITCKSYGAVH